MNTTQTRIIDQLEGAASASASELATSLGMTIPNIRHHLAILQRSQVVERVETRVSPGRGRPTYLYRLRPQSLQNKLDALSQALLDESLAGLSEADRLGFLQRIAARLVAIQTQGGKTPGASQLALRLTQAVQVLNRMAYQARWEAHAQAPRIFFNACPYLAILPDHPELCAMDSQLLASLAGQPAHQAARIDQAHYCLFTIGKERPAHPA